MDAAPEIELAILGAGYVGLVTGASLATLGYSVRCIDRDGGRIHDLRQGKVPFHEPGLDAAVRACVGAGRLSFSTSVRAARDSSAMFIAVGTLDERGDWTGRDVRRAVAELAEDPHAPRTLIVRSTLMPGTSARLTNLARERDPDVEIALNPEFTRQGTAMDDFMNPDRVVVGLTRSEGESGALPILRSIYARIRAPFLVTDAASAEMIKVGANVFLALKAGFANELARVSAATGADVATVVDGIGLDSRIGRLYLTPGPGFGGSCLPSQSRSLPAVAHEHGVPTPIIDAIDPSNAQQAGWVVDILERLVGDLAGKRICVLGLTFKAGTDDVRESAAMRICRALADRGATLVAHDPLGTDDACAAALREGFAIDTAPTAADATRGSDGIVVATEWPEYGSIDWAEVARGAPGRVVVDARQIVDGGAARAAGFRLVGLGRAISAN